MNANYLETPEVCQYKFSLESSADILDSALTFLFVTNFSVKYLFLYNYYVFDKSEGRYISNNNHDLFPGYQISVSHSYKMNASFS